MHSIRADWVKAAQRRGERACDPGALPRSPRVTAEAWLATLTRSPCWCPGLVGFGEEQPERLRRAILTANQPR